MTEAVLSIDVNAGAGEILRLFAAYPVHHLPVVDGTKVVGMLSSADVLKLECFIPAHAPDRQQYLSQRANVATIMRHPAISVLSTQTVEEAARLMASHGIHGLPVTDRQGNLLGIITTTDIMHAALFPERRGDQQDDSGSKSGPVHVSPAQLDHALHLAGSAAEASDDNAAIARALLYVQSRVKSLESVLACAERYLRAGQDERLHAALAKAIQRARRERNEPLPALAL
jgi:CBS domain-containing membrane protein